MKSPFIIFNLLTIHLVDDFYIEVCHLEFENHAGALFGVGKLYRQGWYFDLLYFRLWSQIYLDWIDRRRG